MKTTLKTVLILVLSLTSALAQKETDRWTRVYTGDDANIDIPLIALGKKTPQVDVVSLRCVSWEGIFPPERTHKFARPVLLRRTQAPDNKSRFTLDQGGIIRGDKTKRQLAIVFTGDEFADGAKTIIQALRNHRTKASFFFTGRFYRNPTFRAAIQTLLKDGHYLGAHSNDHLLYCDWTNRNQLLVTRKVFESDLKKNYEAMSEFGISVNEAKFFLPPFEWYNQTISDWTSALGIQLINFTPGTSSNADYTTPAMKNYLGSQAILLRIKSHAERDPAELNGFVLLMHVGVTPERTDKLYDHLDKLIDWLKSKKYELVRIDELLRSP